MIGAIAGSALALAATLGGCGVWRSPTPAGNDVVTVMYGNTATIPVDPPDQLNVLIPVDGSDGSFEWATQECLDMGGTPSYVAGQLTVCQAVDY